MSHSNLPKLLLSEQRPAVETAGRCFFARQTRRRRCGLWAAWGLAAAAWQSSAGAQGSVGSALREVPVAGARLQDGELSVILATPAAGALAAEAASGWLGWLTPAAADGYTVAGAALAELPRPIRVWAIDGERLADGVVGPRALQPYVTNAGPGLRAAWLYAPPLAGDRGVWWLRQGGQPLARFEALWRRDGDAYATVTLLAANIDVASGTVVEPWPAPTDVVMGELRSAVGLTEEVGGALRVWVAAPPGGVPSLARAVFATSAGAWRGSGQIENADGRFWYVRLIEPLGPDVPTVGDEVWIRWSEQAAGRVVGRVFREANALLVDLGEVDGLQGADTVRVLRAGQDVWRGPVAALQTTYARLEAPEGVLEEGDAVVVEQAGRPAGIVRAVHAGGLIEIVPDPGVVWSTGLAGFYDGAGPVGLGQVVRAGADLVLCVASERLVRRAIAAGQRAVACEPAGPKKAEAATAPAAP